MKWGNPDYCNPYMQIWKHSIKNRTRKERKKISGKKLIKDRRTNKMSLIKSMVFRTIRKKKETVV